MYRDGKYSRSEVETIRQHCGELIQSYKDGIASYEALDLPENTRFCDGQIVYWKRCISCLEHCIAVAVQRIEPGE